MSSLARSIFEDLRQRGLLPVAALLLVALVGLPLFALKGSEPVPTAQPAPTATTAAAPGGLPSPNQVLGNQKPLVTLAVLNEPSDLDEFDSSNPFEPIDQVSTEGAGGESGATAPTVGSPGSGGGAAAPETGSGGGTGGGGGGGGGGTDLPQQPSPAPNTDAPQRDDDTTPPQTEKKLTYAVDLAIRGPKGVRRYRGLPKLSLLPSQANPLLVFLGVEDAGTKAVFLVDAKLRSQSGEGVCTPSPEQCATLALAPGERHVLVNDSGRTWVIEIVEVRETSVAKAAAAARKAQKRHARQATRQVGDRPAPRFIPPLITDLFTGGRS